MTTSLYDTMTVATLEAYAMTDYGAFNATIFSDVNVEAQITASEQWVISKGLATSSNLSSSSPDNILLLIKILTKNRLYNILVEKKFLTTDPIEVFNEEAKMIYDAIMAGTQWSFGFASHEKALPNERGDG